jgi:hypothetical protein
VQRGQKAYSILRPIQVKIETNEDGDEVIKLIRRFKTVRALFAYSQTSGEELPQREPQAWSVERAIGELAIARIPWESYEGNTGGYSKDRTFAINPMAPDPFATTIHELGHIENGHTSQSALDEEYRTHRGVCEFEAEATAAVTMNTIGELTDERASKSRAYAQHWMKTEKPSEQSLRRILNASTRIVNAGLEPLVELPD